MQFSIYNITEQYTKEEQDAGSFTEDIDLSNLDTKDLQSAVEASPSKDSLLLSLVDDISEMVVQSPVPEEASSVTSTGGSEIGGDEDDNMVSVADISVHG